MIKVQAFIDTDRKDTSVTNSQQPSISRSSSSCPLHSNLPLGWTFTTAVIQFSPFVIINYAVGLGFCCLVGLARNRQTTVAAASPTAPVDNSFMNLKILLHAERWLLTGEMHFQHAN